MDRMKLRLVRSYMRADTCLFVIYMRACVNVRCNMQYHAMRFTAMPQSAVWAMRYVFIGF
jgi:hypothetical protein